MEQASVIKKLRMRCLQGVQVREAYLIANLARSFKADIIITHENLKADAKNLMEILWLGIRSGGVIEMAVMGDEMERTLAGLESLFEASLPPVFARMDYTPAAVAAMSPWAALPENE